MQITIEEIEVRLVANAVDTEVLATGRLMSPQEVKGYVYSDGSSVDSRAIGWVLCGDVHPKMYQTMQAGEQLESSIGTIVGAAGTRFLVVQQRAGVWAHRFVLPLVGNIACELVNKATSEGFVTSLSARTESQAIVQQLNLGTSIGIDIQHKEIYDIKNPRDFAADLIKATLALLSPHALSNESKEAIEMVCVTTVACEDVYQYLTWLSARGTGPDSTTH